MYTYIYIYIYTYIVPEAVPRPAGLARPPRGAYILIILITYGIIYYTLYIILYCTYAYVIILLITNKTYVHTYNTNHIWYEYLLLHI